MIIKDQTTLIIKIIKEYFLPNVAIGLTKFVYKNASQFFILLYVCHISYVDHMV